jgi:hypothetical protein
MNLSIFLWIPCSPIPSPPFVASDPSSICLSRNQAYFNEDEHWLAIVLLCTPYLLENLKTPFDMLAKSTHACIYWQMYHMLPPPRD